jgi:hypothetical protein
MGLIPIQCNSMGMVSYYPTVINYRKSKKQWNPYLLGWDIFTKPYNLPFFIHKYSISSGPMELRAIKIYFLLINCGYVRLDSLQLPHHEVGRK